MHACSCLLTHAPALLCHTHVIGRVCRGRILEQLEGALELCNDLAVWIWAAAILGLFTLESATVNTAAQTAVDDEAASCRTAAKHPSSIEVIPAVAVALSSPSLFLGVTELTASRRLPSLPLASFQALRACRLTNLSQQA